MMFHEIDPKTLTENVFSLIGDRWMLITAGTPDHCNTMTASWGGLGVLWRKPMATIYVRPQRYTFGFIEQSDEFTLSFFGPQWKKALSYCGAVSGRDEDKFAACGFHVAAAGQAPYIQEADLVLVCKTIWTPLTWTPRPCKNTKPKTITGCTWVRSPRCWCGTDPHPCRREPIPREGGRQ